MQTTPISGVQPPSINLKEIFSEKVMETAFKIIEASLILLRDSENLKVPEFIDLHITQKLTQVSELDIRTGKFFHEVMNVVIELLQTMPTLMASFKDLNSQFPGLAGQIMVVTAIPFVTELIHNLDVIDKAMIDQAIGLA